MRARSLVLAGGLGALAAAGWVRPWRSRTCPSELLDEVLPVAEFRDTISVTVDAPPARVLRAVRRLSLHEMPVAWFLGELRYLPQRLTGRAVTANPQQPFLALLREGIGTVTLGERADELALGTVGRFHRLGDQDTQPLTGAHCFRDFDRPGYEKLAMSFRVTPIGDGAARLTLEHRTHPIGLGARLAFGLYWLVIKPTGAFVTWQMLRAVARLAEQPETEDAPVLSAEDRAAVDAVAEELAASFD